MPDDTFARKFAELVGGLAMASSGFETMIRMQFGESFHHFTDYRLHDAVIVLSKSSAAHAGLAQDAAGEDDDIGIGRCLYSRGAR